MPRYCTTAILLVFLAGCGPHEPYPVPVKGTVQLDGKPLPDGKITFVTNGKAPETLDIKDGQFEGQATWGERKVEIASYIPYRIPANARPELRELMKGGKENILPARYHRQSKLKADVKEVGENTFTFDLASQ